MSSRPTPPSYKTRTWSDYNGGLKKPTPIFQAVSVAPRQWNLLTFWMALRPLKLKRRCHRRMETLLRMVGASYPPVLLRMQNH